MAAAAAKLSLILLLSLLLAAIQLGSSNPVGDIHDLFPKYNLPKGLLPSNVKSYSLSTVDTSFKIELTQSCDVQFLDQLVRYDVVISGKLFYGKVSDVTGIHAKSLFFWVPVTGMDVDQTGTMIDFHVGFLSQKLPVDDFLYVPTCLSENLHRPFLGSE